MKKYKYASILENCYKTLEEIEVPKRYIEILHSEGIDTLGDLVLHSKKDLLSIKRVGRKAIFDLNRVLNKYGFSLRND